MKTKTISLLHYVTLEVRHREYANISAKDALECKEIDKEEEICHVEPPSKEGEPYQLWYANGWKISCERRAKLVAEQKEAQKEHHLMNARRELLRPILEKQLGSENYSMMEAFMNPLIKNPELAKKLYGIDLPV